MDARSCGIFSERWNLMKRFEKPILATRPYSPPIAFYYEVSIVPMNNDSIVTYDEVD